MFTSFQDVCAQAVTQLFEISIVDGIIGGLFELILNLNRLKYNLVGPNQSASV